LSEVLGLDPAGLHLANSRVLVVGLGVSGAEVARVLAQRGAWVFASDSGSCDAGVVSALASAGVEVETGTHDAARAGLRSFDFAFASPGISPIRGFLAEVVASGLPVISELELGVRLTGAPVVAVTGTNGKTTVCRLAERMGIEAGLDVYACGNLETKFITAASEHPDADVFVVEASSFSLTFCDSFHPRVAIVTSLAPDHLDWHGTFEHYRDAKARIAARQTPGELFLYPASQPEIASFAPQDGPVRAPFGSAPMERGAWATSSEIVVRLPSVEMRAGGVDVLAARGPHFAADAAAAAAAMATVGVDAASIERALSGFTFDRHRLEPVGSRDGVRFVDDSVATNTHATLAAIASIAEPVVLIAGGRNKGLDLTPLRDAAGRLRAVIAIGEAAEEVRRVFEPTSVFVPIAGSIGEAVSMATEIAQTGDVVLLSPACASHDWFNNYAERGDAFIDACRRSGVA